MGYRLREGVFCVSVDGRTIFLDIETGRYSALSDRAASEFGIDRRAGPSPELEMQLRHLAARGLLAHGQYETDIEGTRSVPVTASVLDRHWRTSTRPGLATLATIGMAAFHIKTHSLASLLKHLRKKRHGLVAAAMTPPTIERVALQFALARLVLPLRDRCLAESAALVGYLAGMKTQASLVFGVTGRPFAAHCWVQIGETVLNDTVEHVNAFKPILYA